MKILTNDPSIREWGWAVIEVSPNMTRILEAGCIKTDAEHKKRRIRKSDDMVRRLDEIGDALKNLHKKHKFEWLLSELPHGSQNASAAKSLGAVTGLLCAFAVVNALPIDWYSEQDAKKHLSNRKSLTKQETIDLISEIYGESWCTNVQYKDQAIADALAVFHVGKAKSQALIYMTKNHD